MRVFGALFIVLTLAAGPAAGQQLWRLARHNRFIHRFSTLFTAQNVRDYLSSKAGRAEAIAWCKKTGITKVYLEAYRSKYRADKATLLRARKQFRRAGFAVSGGVATTGIGKPSTGWSVVSCYTDKRTQEELRSIFEYAAGIFDEIMIDDFWFTDCTCPECDNARRTRRVVIGDKVFPVRSDSWEDYRSELMFELSRLCLLAASRRVNPKVKFILKYPRWYDRYQERGYDVVRETRVFNRIWVGTETRDLNKGHGEMPYGAYFLMRWLTGIGGWKTGGGWYDPLWTTAKTYIEQARQTILGGAKETVLFSYGALHENFGPADIAALRAQMPELFQVAREVKRRRAVGIAAYKPPNSQSEDEAYVYDDVGMLGLPLAPCHKFPTKAAAAFFPIHALKDPNFTVELKRFITSGREVLLTDGLARRLAGKVELNAENVHVLRVDGRPRSLVKMPERQLDILRAPLLAPFKRTLHSPGKVALYLFNDRSWVLENFRNQPVNVTLDGHRFQIGPRGWLYEWK